jgi:hypothetical protein
MALFATEQAALLGDAAANKLANVTKNDATDLTAIANKGLFVGTGGDLVVRAVGDSVAVTLKNVQDGSYIKGSFARVMATTTASDIVAFAYVAP